MSDGVFRLDPEVYRRHRDEVLRLCNSFQRIGQRGLSDREIAARLSLDERTVTEIRCVAERDCYGLDEWEKAIEFKRRASQEWAALTLRHVTTRGEPDLDPGTPPPRP
jgi:hypothetical protein